MILIELEKKNFVGVENFFGYSFDVKNMDLSIYEVFRAFPALSDSLKGGLKNMLRKGNDIDTHWRKWTLKGDIYKQTEVEYPYRTR